MAKGQKRSNREARKPKAEKPKTNASQPSQKIGPIPETEFLLVPHVRDAAVLLMKAQRSPPWSRRRGYEFKACRVAACIGSVQDVLGAAAAPEWQAHAVARR
jgi:hypothetical protein